MCLPKAICALFPEDSRRLAWDTMLLVKSTNQDLCLLDVSPSLTPLCARIERVTSRYMRKCGIPLHLLQSTNNRKFKLLLHIQMFDSNGQKTHAFCCVRWMAYLRQSDDCEGESKL